MHKNKKKCCIQSVLFNSIEKFLTFDFFKFIQFFVTLLFKKIKRILNSNIMLRQLRKVRNRIPKRVKRMISQFYRNIISRESHGAFYFKISYNEYNKIVVFFLLRF